MTIEERMQFVLHSIESHDRQIGELTAAVNKLVAVSNEDAMSIRSLARIVESHEARLARIENAG